MEVDEYFVAISINNDVKEKEWFTSLVEAKRWAEDYDGTEYSVTIYKNNGNTPIIKYDKKALF